MDILFIQSGHRRIETIVTRQDGVRLSVPVYGRLDPIPHDLGHYVIELELELQDGFWGSVATGALFGGMHILAGRQRPLVALARLDSILAKRHDQPSRWGLSVVNFVGGPNRPSWRVDEMYIKIRKSWMYLYRAVDAQGNPLEFLLGPMWDAEVAKRFFVKALHFTAGSAPQARQVEEQVTQPTAAAGFPVSKLVPRVINVDKNAAYPITIAELKATGTLAESVELRQVKYLNNLVEQDHRFIKRLVEPGMGFFPSRVCGEPCEVMKL